MSLPWRAFRDPLLVHQLNMLMTFGPGMVNIGAVRRALVKVRLCPAHAAALAEARAAAVGREADAARRAGGEGEEGRRRGKRKR